MKCLITFIIISCLFYTNSAGQNSDCIKKVPYEKKITISSDKKTFEAHINIEICYKNDKTIFFTLKPPYYSTNGKKITGKQVQKQELYLLDIFHNKGNIYNVLTIHPDSLKEITDSLTLDFKPKDNVYWKNDSIDFTLKFLYKRTALIKKEQEEKKDVKIKFKLPDNPNPADTVKKEKKDTIPVQAIDSSQISKKRKQTQTLTSIDAEPADTEKLDLNCYDSVSYYYNKIFDLFNKEGEDYEIYKNDKKKLSKRYMFYRTNFLYSYEKCNNPKKLGLKGAFDAADNYLRKELETGSEADEGNVVNKNVEEPNVKKSFNVKDLLLYALSAFFVILVIIYIYSKIKKKRK